MARSKGETGARVEPGALTTRQREVLALVTAGLPNREIGRRLGVSEACVKFHLASLFRHYGVDNRVSVVVRALGEGRLSPLPDRVEHLASEARTAR
jgi:DNA-binding NarL/FixJ family response regulator